MKPNAASLLAAQRTRSEKACATCGARFEGIKIARYCSESCRQKAKYQRSKRPQRETPLSRELKLSRPYDWSNPNLPEDTFLLRVLEGAEIGDIAKCVQRFGGIRMRGLLDRIQDPLTFAISRRKLENAIAALEPTHAAA
jgi:hypothetical protein